MAPKKKRGGKAGLVRKPRTRGIQRRSTDEEVLESTPESETQNEEAEKCEPTTVKSHKKFGKFRCLVTPEKTESADAENTEKVGEITENLQELIIENAEVLVECINEEIVGDISPMEVDPEVKVLTDDSNVEIAKEAETTNETDMTENKEDETSDDKDAENSESSLTKQDAKKAQDKLIPSRKSTRISLKTTKLREMQSATRKPLGKTLGAKKKAKSPKQTDNPVETESNDADSEESSGNKSEESDKVKQEGENTDKCAEAEKLKKPMLKKKLVSGKPKVNVAKKMINLRMGGKTKLIKKKKIKKEPSPEKEDDENSIRRSNRIKTISNQKKTSKGKGLVKKDIKEADSDTSNSGKSDEKGGSNRESPIFVAPVTSTEPDLKPVKVKSRWRRSSELEMNTAQSKIVSGEISMTPPGTPCVEKVPVDEEVERRLKQFVHLKENHYLTERISCKEAKKMTCDCFLTDEEIKQGEYGCGEDCLNRLLMIECGNLCTVGDRCTNKKFQKGQFAPCEAFRTDKKGLGIRASANIPYGEFILEYVGEVLDPDEFEQRATEYSKDKNRHYYFMSLRADAVIDATMKGNISRFINHSCDPNAETQKWTVNGELRIGFFSKRTILAGEEITFDYQFQRYGKEAQKCYCDSATCRGWLGEEPEDGEEEEEEEEEEEAEEEVVKLSAEVKEVAPVEVSKIEMPPEASLEGVVVEQPTQEKVESPKKEKVRIVRPRRKARKDLFEDLDLDDEITSLQATGLKNQAHTLKLSRLMVRAKETTQRTLLLKLLKRGELPCRRLFLDYHGLRLLHGWMTDTQHLIQTDNNKVEHLRLDILQTLAMLPIPNKTMLQDSKVLPTVEKWAVSEKPAVSPISESNSPKSEPDGTQTPVETVKAPEVKEEKEIVEPEANEEDEEEYQIRKSVGMEVTQKLVFKHFSLKNIAEEISSIFDDDEELITEEKEEVKPVLLIKPKEKEYDVVEEILSLAGKLLEEWSGLKEVFRIPKKERIEQMKEHEREADRKYKAFNLEQENLERKRDRYRSVHQRSRIFESSERMRRCMKNEDRSYMHMQQISRHERRKMFAMQVEQAELDRRRKQQEFWQQHVKNCMMMGTDPRFTAPYDPNRGYQCIWNPQIGQWQNYPLPMDPNIMFSHNVPMPHMPNANYPYIPPAALPPQPPRPMQSNPTIHGMHNPHPAQAMENQLPPHMHVPPPTSNIPIPPNIPQGMMPPVNMATMPPVSMGTMPPNISQPNMTQSNMPPVSMAAMPPNMTHGNMGAMPPNMAQNNRTPPLNMPSVNMAPPNMAPPNRSQTNMSPNITQSTIATVNINTMPPNMANRNPPVSMATLPPNMTQTNRTQPNLTQSNIPQVNIATMPPNMAPPNMPPNRTQPNMSPNITQSNMVQTSIRSQSNITQPNLPPINMATMPPNIVQPSMPPASMGTMPPMPNIPPMPSLPYKEEEEPLKVKFMGPIPPPAKLPPKWKCAKDKYGRPYYYHIKIRKSQWEPPEFPPEEEYVSDSTSSSDTSSISSDSSSEDSDSDEIDDSALMLEIRNKFKTMENQKKSELTKKEEIPELTSVAIKTETDESGIEGASMEYKSLEEILAEDIIEKEIAAEDIKEETISSLDKRLMEELGFLKTSSEPPQKKRRVGLVQEILISPRTEEDRLAFREDVKKYRQNKEKLKKQKEIILLQTKKHVKSAGNGNGSGASGTPSGSGTSKTGKSVKKKITVKTKLKEIEGNSLELTKKIKESFRSSMASVMVGILNAYRKPECKQGRITNTEDFKHLARKLTHFVMLKELKHCQKIEDLTCTDSVKQKAKEFVRKYMSKFGEAYLRPSDDFDNY